MATDHRRGTVLITDRITAIRRAGKQRMVTSHEVPAKAMARRLGAIIGAKQAIVADMQHTAGEDRRFRSIDLAPVALPGCTEVRNAANHSDTVRRSANIRHSVARVQVVHQWGRRGCTIAIRTILTDQETATR
jgi:hypothetical protein